LATPAAIAWRHGSGRSRDLARGERAARALDRTGARVIACRLDVGSPAYAVSKAALNALTRLLASELRRDRILVNAVCPGWTDTDMGPGGQPVAHGAASVVWAVTLDDDGPSGGFFRDGKPLPW
jgi:NAD(P)-dependent dehydrogenase (short-subunit alcohol dehydrogenase family)